MASTRGRKPGSSSTRSTRNTRSSAPQKRRQSEPMDIAIRSEVMLITLCAICILLFLCNFHIIGPVGDAISGFMFGVFGLIAYVVPVVMFFAVAFGISNIGNSIATRKLIAGLVLCLLFMIISDIISAKLSAETVFQVKDIYARCSENRNGGGLIGGILAYLMVHFLSVKGAVLVAAIVAVICLIIITDKSLLQGVSNQGKRVYERSKEDSAYRKERLEERKKRQEESRLEQERLRKERSERMKEERKNKEEAKEAEKILRMDKRVSGVMLDTALSKEPEKVTPEKGRDDLHEIMLNQGEEIVEDQAPVGYQGYEHMIETVDAVHEIHEIHFDEDEAVSDEPEEIPASNPDLQLFRRESIDAVVHKDGKTYGVDQGLYGEGAANKPMASYSTEMGNTMAADPNKKRPAAVLKKETEPAHLTGMNPVQDTTAKPEQPIAPPPVKKPAAPKKYVLPPISLLSPGMGKKGGDTERELRDTAARLQQTLASFGVRATITDISQGPSVTRYELQPEQGVKVSKIVGLADDIKLNLAATDIRIEAPIPGKAAVGIEVPNKENSAVALRELFETKEFKNFNANLAFAVGKDIGGQTVVTDIAKMPHMLIAGATGSGKSVCINTIIMSILYKAHPDDVKLIMIDPKVVELSVYNGIPHLLIPVVTDPKKATSALHWGVVEMTERYKKFADMNVRDLKGYNQKVQSMYENGEPGAPEKMPQIVIIVDELADLMMVASGEVEESICRLAQLARAAGIHLIIATQRPSVDVITGLIKANMPSRVAFAVSSGVDSRTILDMNGAEKLLGKGDMLFYPQGYPKPARIQGAFVSDKEVSDVVDYLKNQAYVSDYGDDVEEKMKNLTSSQQSSGGGASEETGSDLDQYFVDAGRFIIEKEKASIGMLQRVFKIGFNRAARIMDQLCEAGVVGEEEGTKPRKILMTLAEFEQLVGGSYEE